MEIYPLLNDALRETPHRVKDEDMLFLEEQLRTEARAFHYESLGIDTPRRKECYATQYPRYRFAVACIAGRPWGSLKEFEPCLAGFLIADRLGHKDIVEKARKKLSRKDYVKFLWHTAPEIIVGLDNPAAWDVMLLMGDTTHLKQLWENRIEFPGEDLQGTDANLLFLIDIGKRDVIDRPALFENDNKRIIVKLDTELNSRERYEAWAKGGDTDVFPYSMESSGMDLFKIAIKYGNFKIAQWLFESQFLVAAVATVELPDDNAFIHKVMRMTIEIKDNERSDNAKFVRDLMWDSALAMCDGVLMGIIALYM